MKNFIIGLLLPVSGFKLWLKHPKMWLYALIPWALSLSFYFFTVTWLISSVDQLLIWTTNQVTPAPSEWLVLFQRIAGWVIKFLSIIFAGWSFAFVTQWFCFPFYDFLARAAELTLKIEMPLQEPPFFKLAMLDLRKSVVGLLITLVALTLSLVPALNILTLLATWVIFCFQFTSYAQSRRGYGVKKSFKHILLNLPMTLGFGLSSSFLLSLPWFGPLLTPYLVVAGAIYFSKTNAGGIHS